MARETSCHARHATARAALVKCADSAASDRWAGRRRPCRVGAPGRSQLGAEADRRAIQQLLRPPLGPARRDSRWTHNRWNPTGLPQASRRPSQGILSQHLVSHPADAPGANSGPDVTGGRDEDHRASGRAGDGHGPAKRSGNAACQRDSAVRSPKAPRAHGEPTPAHRRTAPRSRVGKGNDAAWDLYKLVCLVYVCFGLAATSRVPRRSVVAN